MNIPTGMSVADLERLLEEEKIVGPPLCRADYEVSLARRAAFSVGLMELRRAVSALSSAHYSLPRLAPEGYVRRATSMLRMFNLSFVVIDTTGLSADADILRILVADAGGDEAYHAIIRPLRQNNPNTAYTGLTAAHLAQAPTLADVWTRLTEALEGAYVLAYNIDFVQEHLDESARHYGLPPIQLIGDCLQHTACQYFGEDRPISLADACKRIGHEMIDRYAHARVAAQVALLKAMSEGITQVPGDEQGDMDEHPF